MQAELGKVDVEDIGASGEYGWKIRDWVVKVPLPQNIPDDITYYYQYITTYN
jgi:hypothetical protein